MFSKLVKGVVVSAMAVVGQSALAAGPHDFNRHNDRNFDRGYDYARVVDVDPIVNRMRVSVPTQQCWNEERYESGGYRQSSPRQSSSAGATLVGGLLGAVVGNQFGHGDGRRAATVAGAVLGAAVGSQTAASRGQRDDYYDEPIRRDVERCQTHYEDRVEERIEGYRVSYVYNGRRYTTQMPYDPGNRIRIRVNVHPAGF
ncbi:MAG: glycine zipper 2TM domain-containing protein [Steroidobacteraceae bacterium]